jgi:signal transduction histidine kinase
MQIRSTLKDHCAEDEKPGSSSGLIAHIQNATEHQKALLARELHDELGGMLVGAVMDLAWAEQHVSGPPLELKQKLTRARQTLSAAIDSNRRLIEELRPTLLDNVGLFAALRWHVQAICKRANIDCTIHLPEEERRFLPNIPIILFRIVQETYALIIAAGHIASSEFDITIDRLTLIMRIVTKAPPTPTAAAEGIESHFLSAIEYRTAALGGSFERTTLPAGDVRLQAAFPLEGILPGTAV